MYPSMHLGRQPPSQADHPPGQSPPCSVHAGIHPAPLPAATATDDTQPTGMHTLFLNLGSRKVFQFRFQESFPEVFGVTHTS